ASKHARLKELGVAHTIDYNTQDFQAEVARLTGGRGVDLALDAVGGASFSKSYASLAPLGRLFIFRASSFSSRPRRSIPTILKGFFALPSFKPLRLMNENRGVFGLNLGRLWNESAKTSEMFREIVDLVAKGRLDPVVDRSFAFDKAGEAHTYMA